jgi:hypothetical protein
MRSEVERVLRWTDAELANMRSDTYRVLYGWSEWQDFQSFEEALAFWAKTPAAEIRNIDRMDSDGCTNGLTEDERAMVGL